MSHTCMARNKITQDILDMLVEASDLTFEWMANPYKQYRRIQGIMEPEEWNRIFRERKKRRALKELKRKKWLSERQEGNRIIYEIEEAAIVHYLKESIRFETSILPTPMTILVTFDFPEAARKARNSFRHLLKQIGFKQKQLSVWFSNKSVANEMHALVHALKLEKWVNVYLAQGT